MDLQAGVSHTQTIEYTTIAFTTHTLHVRVEKAMIVYYSETSINGHLLKADTSRVQTLSLSPD